MACFLSFIALEIMGASALTEMPYDQSSLAQPHSEPLNGDNYFGPTPRLKTESRGARNKHEVLATGLWRLLVQAV